MEKDSKEKGGRRLRKVPDVDERAASILASIPDLANPAAGLFDQGQAHAYSSYSGILQPQAGDDPRSQKVLRYVPAGKLWPEKTDSFIDPQGEAAHDMLRAHILGEYYPCIGARSAFSHGTYRIGFYKELAHLSAVAAMGRDLRRFTQEYEKLGDFTTFIAFFKYPQLTNEDEFEAIFWQHLNLLAQYDKSEWDPKYSSDPESGNFAFSFNKTAFFVIGMHAGASRFARRFAFPALVFNPESQIQRLKDEGMLEKFAHTVRERDTLYQGSINPSLPVSGNTTGGEARVYSGKAHPAGEIWKCPFHANKGK